MDRILPCSLLVSVLCLRRWPWHDEVCLRCVQRWRFITDRSTQPQCSNCVTKAVSTSYLLFKINHNHFQEITNLNRQEFSSRFCTSWTCFHTLYYCVKGPVVPGCSLPEFSSCDLFPSLFCSLTAVSPTLCKWQDKYSMWWHFECFDWICECVLLWMRVFVCE